MKFIVENESEQEQEACWDELKDIEMLWLTLEIVIYNLDDSPSETWSIPRIHVIQVHLSVGFSRCAENCDEKIIFTQFHSRCERFDSIYDKLLEIGAR
jgi:hypothetical protein